MKPVLIALFLVVAALGALIGCDRPGAEPPQEVFAMKEPQGTDDLNRRTSRQASSMKKTQSTDHLTELQYRVTQGGATEAPFTGEYWDTTADGVYRCVVCGQPLYDSQSKYQSGCGWPSFTEAIAEGRVVTREDRSAGMVRTEILCGNCGGHLGHVFDDGPGPTFKRHCVNSASLKLTPKP